MADLNTHPLAQTLNDLSANAGARFKSLVLGKSLRRENDKPFQVFLPPRGIPTTKRSLAGYDLKSLKSRT